MPFSPNAYDPNRNINIAHGAQPTAEELGAHAVAVNLGANSTPAQLGAAPQADVWTFKDQRDKAPALPFGTPQTEARNVIKQAQAMATEDAGPSTPPLVAVPLVINGITPQGEGIPEYNVSTPYAGGPGLNENDVAPAQTDASGRRVLNVSGANVTPASPPKSKALMWVAIAALVALVVFDS